MFSWTQQNPLQTLIRAAGDEANRLTTLGVKRESQVLQQRTSGKSGNTGEFDVLIYCLYVIMDFFRFNMTKWWRAMHFWFIDLNNDSVLGKNGSDLILFWVTLWAVIDGLNVYPVYPQGRLWWQWLSGPSWLLCCSSSPRGSSPPLPCLPARSPAPVREPPCWTVPPLAFPWYPNTSRTLSPS